MLSPKGHYLDLLIEFTFFFKKKFQILWFLNKNFKLGKNFAPKNVNIKKIINSNKFEKKKNKFLYFAGEIFIFVRSIYEIFYLIIYFSCKKKLLKFLLALTSNYFFLPRYFKSFYFAYINHGLKKSDHIIIPSCRKKDISLIYFLVKIENDVPKIHLRIFFPPKKGFKSFYYYLNKMKIYFKAKNIYIYTYGEYTKNLIKKNTNFLINTEMTNLPYSFFKRRLKFKNYTIGYLGEARFDKGFHLMPALIRDLEKKGFRFNYIIQITNTSNNILEYEKQLIRMSKLNPRIKIIKKYCDFLDFRKLLRKIDIMPILYNLDQLNKSTSGIFYSCITHEIPKVIPKKCEFMMNILNHKSFEKFNGIDDCANKIIKIAKNYNIYLKAAKKNSKILKDKLDKDPIKLNTL